MIYRLVLSHLRSLLPVHAPFRLVCWWYTRFPMGSAIRQHRPPRETQFSLANETPYAANRGRLYD